MACAYFLNRKRTICVITLNGTLVASDAEVLEHCIKAAQSEPTNYILVNLSGITAAEVDVLRPFTLFQQALRSKAKLVICGLTEATESVLKGGGVLRESELAEDLVAGLQLIMKWEKG